jgi:hypothetical protein
MWLPWTQKRLKQSTKGGDARIELATSCTQSRNHTTRPITLEPAWAGQTTGFDTQKRQGRAGVEPATYRAATNCSTTELTPQRQLPRRWRPPTTTHASMILRGSQKLTCQAIQAQSKQQTMARQKNVEEQGIDPCASCMQSRRSTI